MMFRSVILTGCVFGGIIALSHTAGTIHTIQRDRIPPLIHTYSPPLPPVLAPKWAPPINTPETTPVYVQSDWCKSNPLITNCGMFKT